MPARNTYNEVLVGLLTLKFLLPFTENVCPHWADIVLHSWLYKWLYKTSDIQRHRNISLTGSRLFWVSNDAYVNLMDITKWIRATFERLALFGIVTFPEGKKERRRRKRKRRQWSIKDHYFLQTNIRLPLRPRPSIKLRRFPLPQCFVPSQPPPSQLFHFLLLSLGTRGWDPRRPSIYLLPVARPTDQWIMLTFCADKTAYSLIQCERFSFLSIEISAVMWCGRDIHKQKSRWLQN